MPITIVSAQGHFKGRVYSPVIIRHASDSRYLFPEWERSKRFPELNNLPNKTVCFRKLVLVLSAYFSILFRRKMESNVVNSCFNCKGRGLYGSSLYSFRRCVITSCGLTDEEERIGNRITIVSCTPYKRWTKDELGKFQRVLSNKDELIKAGFPTHKHHCSPHGDAQYLHTGIFSTRCKCCDGCTRSRFGAPVVVTGRWTGARAQPYVPEKQSNV